MLGKRRSQTRKPTHRATPLTRHLEEAEPEGQRSLRWLPGLGAGRRGQALGGSVLTGAADKCHTRARPSHGLAALQRPCVHTRLNK